MAGKGGGSATDVKGSGAQPKITTPFTNGVAKKVPNAK